MVSNSFECDDTNKSASLTELDTVRLTAPEALNDADSAVGNRQAADQLILKGVLPNCSVVDVGEAERSTLTAAAVMVRMGEQENAGDIHDALIVAGLNAEVEQLGSESTANQTPSPEPCQRRENRPPRNREEMDLFNLLDSGPVQLTDQQLAKVVSQLADTQPARLMANLQLSYDPILLQVAQKHWAAQVQQALERAGHHSVARELFNLMSPRRRADRPAEPQSSR